LISKRALLTILGGVLLAVGAASDGAAGGPSKKEQRLLEKANRRWRGARCRTRVLLEVKKGREGDGWSNCKWIWWSPEGGNERVRVRVSDGKALRNSFRRGVIPHGTRVIASGWGAEDGGALYLEWQFEGLPVRARVYFYDDWVGRVGPGRVDQIERWARFELLEILSSPDEQLTAPPPVAPARPPQPAPRVVQPSAPAVVTLQVMAASVEPPRVVPGNEVQLGVVYTVNGLAPGRTTTATETRAILHDQAVLFSVDAAVQRSNGTHQSSQPLHLPLTLAPGVYELHVTVALGGSEETASAMFQVTSRRP
jgi:hypothetical protein